MTGDAVRVDDVVETMNSCELFDVMIDSHDATITAEPLKNYHRLLKAGTGRVGRIVMFQQCLQNGVMPFIVLEAQKEFF
ncbi:hypothetical protein ACSHWG_07100 [Leucobacter sp. Z1108]|uniref:hypothetical protein n=1 Tax=Leucobacter sp. Z1108 TaxID=3439066 RepID=UPI003F39A01D